MRALHLSLFGWIYKICRFNVVVVKINCILKKFRTWNVSPIHENDFVDKIKNLEKEVNRFHELLDKRNPLLVDEFEDTSVPPSLQTSEPNKPILEILDSNKPQPQLNSSLIENLIKIVVNSINEVNE